ncbi:MAG: DUF4834 family protein [Bacteroidota bacterium]|nr:DUF4834 family protein [Bacteroidota bacterium]
MIKFLIITFIIFYLIFKFGGLLLRFVFRAIGARVQQKYTEQHNTFNRTKPNGSNVDVEYKVPKQKNPEFKGGEYVDYEDVK